MVYIDLVFNLGLLVALCIISNGIEDHWQRNTRLGMISQGLLFGAVSVISMLNPIDLAPGVLFDGRSITLSLCALFFEPWAALISGAIVTAFRLCIGGTGAIPGVLAIVISIIIGLLARTKLTPDKIVPSNWQLFFFGSLVHLSLFVMMMFMISFVDFSMAMTIVPPMLLLNPLATVLAGRLLSGKIVSWNVSTELRKNESLLKETQALSKIGGWEFNVATGQMTWTDQVFEIYGVKAEEYNQNDISRNLSFYAPECIGIIETSYEKALKTGEPYDLELEFCRANGERIWVRTIGKPESRDHHVVRIAGYIMDITERRQMESAMLEKDKLCRLLVENSPDAIFLEINENFDYLNQSAAHLFGSDSVDTLIGTPISERFHPDYRQSVREGIWLFRNNESKTSRFEKVCLRLNGEPVNVEVSAVQMEFENRRGTLFFLRDITNRIENEKTNRSLQAQLLQAQKMESIGRLAGGVAHDYNNMLSVILGYTELLLIRLDPEDPIYPDLEIIQNAAKRSVNITRQLLAFARQQTIAPKVLYLNETVESMLSMLRRLLGENLDLAWLPGKKVWPIKMDPTQIDQILANLCVNARDAIENVGKVTIETCTAILDESHCESHAGLKPGDYVVLSVSDNGHGMDRETLDHIFEPFFTTKKLGYGTGLGLATVYGIVKQNDGFIYVYSEPGEGTMFTIYFRRYAGVVESNEQKNEDVIPMGEGESVLVVEDEPSILDLSEKILMNLGYKVYLARTPSEAIKLAEAHDGILSLLITDVVLPEMNGRELSVLLQKINPQIASLFMSGYTADVITHHGILQEGFNFIQKPFSRYDLARKVREALDSK